MTGARAIRPTRGARFGGRFNDRTWQVSRFGVVKEWADDPRVLLCDYDRPGDCPRVPQLRAVCNRVRIHALWFRQDRTRHGWHLVVRCRERFTDMERVNLQLLLGSDPNREGLNFFRARSLAAFPSAFWSRRWNLLFERKI